MIHDGSVAAKQQMKMVIYMKFLYVASLILTIKFVPQSINIMQALVQMIACSAQEKSHFLRQRWHSLVAHAYVSKLEYFKFNSRSRENNSLSSESMHGDITAHNTDCRHITITLAAHHGPLPHPEFFWL